ncbi:MAG: dihydroneopterin aldolase [Paludibacteraceae bacterium]|nr:dihydroneopterin aldolase [Paludibacteraceae bacterium]
MTEITLQNIRIYAHHGFFKEEQEIGCEYEVTVTVRFDGTKAELEDDIDGTVNYQEIYDVVKEEMSKRSKLIENVARRIIDAINDRFPQIKYTELSLSKINPPITGQVGKATVRLISER